MARPVGHFLFSFFFNVDFDLWVSILFSVACYLVIWNLDFYIGLCTDGAPVNIKLYNLIKSCLVEHYLLTLCPAHKIELAIQDTFESSDINNECNRTIWKSKLKMEAFQEKINIPGNTLYLI